MNKVNHFLAVSGIALMLCTCLLPGAAGAATPDTDDTINGVKAYNGEITDQMITSFLRADTKRRAVLAKAEETMRAIMTAEQLTPSQYVTIGRKMRTDTVFLERVRGVAAQLVQEEVAQKNKGTA